MVQSTPFIGEYNLRFNYSALMKLAKEFELKSIVDLGNFFSSGKLDDEGIIKTILIGLRKENPNITAADLTKEDGLFDQFMEKNGYGDLVNDVVVQSLIDAGVLAKMDKPAGDKGEASPKV